MTIEEDNGLGSPSVGAVPFPPADAICEAIKEAGGLEDQHLSSAFQKKNESTPNSGWALLMQVFGFHFRAGNVSEPFGPMMVMDGRRSMIPDDLSEAELDKLQSTLEAVSDPEYRARVADVLWLRRRDAKAARVAVEAYIAAGMRVEDSEHWVGSMERYERGLRLARQIDPKGDLPKTVLSHLQDRVVHYDGSDPLFFSCKALEFLAEFRFGDFEKLAGIAGRVADKSRGEKHFARARSYFEIQAKLLRLAKDNDAAEAALVASAETFVEEAEDRESAGAAIAAHVFWEDAVRAFRDRPSLRARIPELQRRLADAGKKTLSEMKSVGHAMDIRELVEMTEGEFRGLQLDDALLKFTTFNSLIDPEKLRAEVISSAQKYPLQSLFDAAIYDEGGRKIAVRPSIHGADEKTQEKAIEGLMDQHARIQRNLIICGYVAPALRTILGEHTFTEADIERLIADSAFIPKDRMPLFIRAIMEGLRWDFCAALHFFVPQAENSLRYILEQCGVVPRNIDADGVETVWSVERTLDHPILREQLGESFIFELQSLLAGRFGPNIRNSLAHGLFSANALNSESAFYLWWVLLRLTLIPTAAMKAYQERSDSQP